VAGIQGSAGDREAVRAVEDGVRGGPGLSVMWCTTLEEFCGPARYVVSPLSLAVIQPSRHSLRHIIVPIIVERVSFSFNPRRFDYVRSALQTTPGPGPPAGRPSGRGTPRLPRLPRGSRHGPWNPAGRRLSPPHGRSLPPVGRAPGRGH